MTKIWVPCPCSDCRRFYRIVIVIVALAVLAALLALAAPAQAQLGGSVCGDRAEIIKVLANKYQEAPRAFGIAGSRNLAELFVSKTGSWTMLMTQPQGITCILATGQSWEELMPTVLGESS